MDQHPIPQHIASFEFKLFGNLTVRQFVTLAIPMSFAILIFFSNINVIVRLPATLIFAAIGLFAALVPVDGRPLDKWLLAFIRAILSPTQRVWVKETILPRFLSVVIAKPQAHTPQTPTTQVNRGQLLAYLAALPKGSSSAFDVQEQAALKKIDFTAPLPLILPLQGQGQLASLQPIHEVKPPSSAISFQTKAYMLSGLEKKLEIKKTGTFAQPLPKIHLASEVNSAVENVISIKMPDRQIRLLHGIGKTRVRKLHFAPPVGFDLSKLPIRGERRFEISEELKRRFELPLQDGNGVVNEVQASSVAPKVTAIPNQPRFIPKSRQNQDIPKGVFKKPAQDHENLDSKISVILKKPLLAAQNILSKAHIVPLTSTPNIISGIITLVDGSSLEAAILTFRDASGIPVRALKTNKLGQFLSVTPLPNGQYQIEIESDLATFAPLAIELSGQVVEPLAIKAQGGPPNA